jgi:voltage-gated potassium channel
MDFIRQASVAAVLIVLTLSFHSGGMVVLIQWGRGHFVRDISRIGVLRSAVLIIQFTGVMIVLHLLQILPMPSNGRP